ncbi:MAG: hypothetical protein K0U64_05555 [Actinomycetia bacterium]|nr:hypothetical protein [Actinomycetes bacterium]
MTPLLASVLFAPNVTAAATPARIAEAPPASALTGSQETAARVWSTFVAKGRWGGKVKWFRLNPVGAKRMVTLDHKGSCRVVSLRIRASGKSSRLVHRVGQEAVSKRIGSGPAILKVLRGDASQCRARFKLRTHLTSEREAPAAARESAHQAFAGVIAAGVHTEKLSLAVGQGSLSARLKHPKRCRRAGLVIKQDGRRLDRAKSRSGVATAASDEVGAGVATLHVAKPKTRGKCDAGWKVKVAANSPAVTPGPTADPIGSPKPDAPKTVPQRPAPTPDRARSPGLPKETVLAPSSGFTVTTANQVIDGLDVQGSIQVDAPGVIIRNSRITGNGTGNGIRVLSGDVTIEDTEIANFANGIAYSNWTARRVNVHSMTSDGVKLGSNVLLEDSWIHDLNPDSDAHADGGQVQTGVRNTIIRNNTISIGEGNSALFIAPSQGPNSPGPVIIEGNHLDGGNFTIQVVDGNHGEYFIDDIQVLNNTWGTDNRYGTHRTNVPVTWSGNTDYATGQAIPL